MATGRPRFKIGAPHKLPGIFGRQRPRFKVSAPEKIGVTKRRMTETQKLLWDLRDLFKSDPTVQKMVMNEVNLAYAVCSRRFTCKSSKPVPLASNTTAALAAAKATEEVDTSASAKAETSHESD